MKRILIVEDDRSVLQGLAENLRREHYEVCAVEDGEEGYKLAREKKFDLILLDVMLPGMDGLEICKQLRSEGVQIPILMLTAKGEEIDKVLGLELGADDYLTKPFSVRELVSRIKALLRRQIVNQPRVKDLLMNRRRVKEESDVKESLTRRRKDYRKLAAIMFTDMVGYSALTQKNETLGLELLEDHRGILRQIFPRYDGVEIEIAGDSFLVEFESALQAVRCAIEIQKTLFERNASVPEDRQVQLRVGVHVGDVVHRENRVHGDGVNIAARLEPLAEPGGICLSQAVAHQVQNMIELPVLTLGKRSLKNIQLPMEIYKVVLPWEKSRTSLFKKISLVFRRKKRH